jgi:hypothetical protein
MAWLVPHKRIIKILFIVLSLLGGALPAFAAKDYNIKNDSTSFFFVSGTSGNVGIGTIVPVGKLNIEGGAAASSRIVNIGGAFADLDGSRTGLYVDVTAPVVGNFGASGSWSQVRTTAASGIYASAITGAYTEAMHQGASTVSDLMGLMTLANQVGSGPVTNAYGVYPQVWKGSAPGAIQNAYGMYYQGVPNANGDTGITTGTLVNQYGLGILHLTTATTRNIGILLDDDTVGALTSGDFGILQEDTAPNSFAGNIGVGTTQVTAQLVLGSDGTTLVDKHWNKDTTAATANESHYVVGKSDVNITTPAPVEKFRFFAGYGGFQEVGQIAVSSPGIVTGSTLGGAIDFYTQGVDNLVKRMTIDSVNVGIGTDVPLAKLHIATDNAFPDAMPITGSDLYVKGNIELDGKIYGDGSALTNLGLAGYVPYTGALSNVDLGIYTLTSGVIYSQDATKVYKAKLEPVKGSGIYTVLELSTTDSTGVLKKNFKFGTDPAYPTYSNIWAPGVASPTGTNYAWQMKDTGNEVWFNSTGMTVFAISNIEKVTINSGGLGVNYVYSSPAMPAKLSVKGGGTTTGLSFLTVDSGDVQRFKIHDNGNAEFLTGNVAIGTSSAVQVLDVRGSQYVSGNLGIGTTTPVYKLDVLGSTAYPVRIKGSTGGGLILGEYNNEWGGFWAASVTPSSGNFALIASFRGTSFNAPDGTEIGFGINASRAMTINSSGNVGIGTTAPVANLHIGAGTPSLSADLSSKSVLIKGNLEVDGKIYGDGSLLTGVATTAALTTNYVTKMGAFSLANSAIYSDANGSVGIGTTIPLATYGGLDISSGGLSLVLGADNILTTRTNSTAKNGRIGSAHYLNAEEPMAMLIATSGSTNVLSVGGGTSLMNAATQIDFYTATNTTTTTGTNRMTLDANGNVGIGTTIPANMLDVSGNIRINSSNSILKFRDSGTTQVAQIQLNSAGRLGFFDDSSLEKMTILTHSGADQGYVGIGTTTPVANLHIGAGTPSLAADLSTSSALIKGNLEVDGKIYGDGSALTGLSSSQWTTTGSNIYYNAGNVGIGTATNLLSKLQIWMADTHTTGAYTGPGTLLLYNNQNNADEQGAALMFGSNYEDGAGQQFTTRAGIKGGTDAAGNTADGYLAFYTTTGAANNNLERMRITSAGNVGIGTTTPLQALHVFVTSGQPALFSGSSQSGGTIRLQATGSTGFSGANLYDEAGVLSGSFQYGNTAAAAFTDQFVIASRKSTTPVIFYQGGYTSGYERLRLDTAGNIIMTANVGIGTTDPAANLHIGAGTPTLSADLSSNSALIKGNLEVDGKIYGDGSLLTGLTTTAALTTNYVTKMGASALANSIVYDNGTNVGIGVASPSAKLEVNGTLIVGGSSDTYFNGNVGVGSTSPMSSLDVKGSFAVYRAAKSASATSAGETIIGVTDTSATRTITLATADVKAGRVVIVKDESGGAGANNITIATEGAQAIDGDTSDTALKITVGYGVVRLYSDGSNWFTF